MANGKSSGRGRNTKSGTPTVGGALAAFANDLGLVVGFARALRSGIEPAKAFADLHRKATASWSGENSPASGGAAPTDDEAKAFASGLGEVIADADRELSAHKRGEERGRKRKRNM